MDRQKFYISFEAEGIDYALPLANLIKIVTKNSHALSENSVYAGSALKETEIFDLRPEAEQKEGEYNYMLELVKNDGSRYGLVVSRVNQVLDSTCLIATSQLLQRLAAPYWRGILKNTREGWHYNLIAADALYDYLDENR